MFLGSVHIAANRRGVVDKFILSVEVHTLNVVLNMFRLYSRASLIHINFVQCVSEYKF